MNVKRFLFYVVLILTLDISAQSIAPQSVNCGASSMSQSNGSLSFTVGELVVLTQEDVDGNSLSGGFTSSSTISTASVKNVDASLMEINVFPNPTENLLNIHVSSTSLDHFFIRIIDTNGKETYMGKYTHLASNILINLASYPSGTYMLSLSDENANEVATYRIIKH